MTFLGALKLLFLLHSVKSHMGFSFKPWINQFVAFGYSRFHFEWKKIMNKISLQFKCSSTWSIEIRKPIHEFHEFVTENAALGAVRIMQSSQLINTQLAMQIAICDGNNGIECCAWVSRLECSQWNRKVGDN